MWGRLAQPALPRARGSRVQHPLFVHQFVHKMSTDSGPRGSVRALTSAPSTDANANAHALLSSLGSPPERHFLPLRNRRKVTRHADIPSGKDYSRSRCPRGVSKARALPTAAAVAVFALEFILEGIVVLSATFSSASFPSPLLRLSFTSVLHRLDRTYR